ncbi:Alpha/beta superfamily hydrolase [Streptococcus infantarius subsp. infantarius]|uniref:alpha/beta fold hydrolase n=1 Tax=Streptococcus infantarius TaxID=102684 RepID=UPI00208FDECC|nr:alpha/beta hydrolase [Streptococcus infantarius]MCO4467271.1 Alpha/beta superfamily hydrolase [Streptococcus infantarius subsp. infantarius]MCO4470145.1 Alpha/beta superfamily hydrolase [Streptococcus infantarius subsp. infantarius]MCO4478164.1 Alpha/beta superfamily hydrolase [Streptococcus infantarius subsp. infantarius]MCO4485741.1 Alpha/beta superfamily hydrolase [Streptococcus infantarius subsp. infantarius]MCO4648612.1 Alpha/beta superfamily hydrolase [Streptococcus infantarius subsp.
MKVVEVGQENQDVIVLLHGGGFSWWQYQAQMDLLCENYHVVLPILDGHAGSDADFTSIEDNAKRLLDYIDKTYGGSVFLIAGLSLGGQILLEMLALRKDICQYAIVESAAIIPDKLTAGLVAPLFSMSFPLIKKKWFAKMQFCYLGIRADLFEHYYGDTVKLSKQNLIAFIKASSLYQVKKNLKNSLARVRIIVGEKETKKMHASARYLHDLLPDSRLEIKAGLAHGQYAINQPDLYVKELFESL